MRRVIALLAVLVLVAGLVPLAIPSFAGPNDAPIRLKAVTFRPGLGEKPNLPPGLTIAEVAPGKAGYYLVQFAGPVQAAWKDAVVNLGAEILDYIPDFAFKVRMTPEIAAKIGRLSSVVWLDVFQPAYKLSPNLARDGIRLYKVQLERNADARPAMEGLVGAGALIFSNDEHILVIAADGAQLEALAHVPDVAWIENFILYEKHNEYGAGGILGANTANTNGYDGSSQIAAVADTGLGDGTASGAHPDIPSSRITAIYDWPAVSSSGCYIAYPDGAQDVDSGHGTHTSGSVLSDGGASGEGKGTAPAAHLVFQAVEDYVDMYGACAAYYPDGYYLTGLPIDIRDLFQQAYNAGARIHSNSWGSDVAGDYTEDAANTDDFVWDNPDMAITFSAGNDATDANSDGVVDQDSMGAPGTAKNVITVGASENNRQGHYECDTNLTYTSHDAYQTGETCASMSGNNFLGTYGQRYPDDFPVDPLASDVTAGNQEQMASWSSRGPTDDGRIKPDVVGPGTWVLSGYSSLYQEGYGDPVNPQDGIYQWDGWGMPNSETYKYMGGTSMSTPLVAGGATVVRDFYYKEYSHNASAALVKATLINSAVDMLDENNDGDNDNDYPIPNYHEGWGRVNLANATDESHEYVDQTTGIGTSGSAVYYFDVDTAGSPFKVSLVWSDYPAAVSANPALVNDLDLTVTAPGGTVVYKGNVFSGGWSQTGGSADRTNNVENVYVQSAGVGTWTIQVSGYNVPQGPQPFALVVDGELGAPPPTPTPTPTQPVGTMHVGDLDGSSAWINKNFWRATVTITVHDSSHNPVTNATVYGTWSGGYSGTTQCTTGGSGQCTVQTGGVSKNQTSVTFTVNNVTHATYTYQPSSNHDPDGDSNGTVITVNKP
jgi:serine protease AprX